MLTKLQFVREPSHNFIDFGLFCNYHIEHEDSTILGYGKATGQ